MTEIRLNVTDRTGGRHDLVAATGRILMHVLRDNVDLMIGTCGGELSCGTCLVRLTRADSIEPAGADEAEMLEALNAGDNARLACQIVLDETSDGMQATLLHEE